MDAFDKRLKEIWTEMMGTKRVHKRFTSFLVFREWANKNGFEPDAELCLTDPNGMYCEGNCYFDSVRPDDTIVGRLTASWDRTVDAIRLSRGLPPLPMSNPCPGCPDEAKCEKADTVCATRLRYWDAGMERLRGGSK